MTRMLDDLGTLLEQELEACEKIRELAILERQAVVAIDPPNLDRINQDLQGLLTHVGQMALKRLRVQETLRQEMKLPDDDVRLTQLVPHLPESHRDALKDRSEKLKVVYREISHGVATNQVLMQEYMQTARGMFTALAGADESIPTYSKRGTTSGPQEPPVSFERMA